MNDIHNLDLNLLKSLQALIVEQHVGRAAKRLNVTQPAMSHALRRLREQFDDPLLVRSGNQMVPTPRAVELGAKLGVIFSEIRSLAEERDFTPENLQGDFRIDTHDFVASEHLADAFRGMNRQAPGLSLHLNTFSPDSYEALDSGKVDLVVGADLQANPRFIQRVIAEDPFVCLMASGHPALDNWTLETVFHYTHTSFLDYSTKRMIRLKPSRDHKACRPGRLV